MSSPDPYAPPRATPIAPLPDEPPDASANDVVMVRRGLLVLLATVVLDWTTWAVEGILLEPRAGESMEAVIARTRWVPLLSSAFAVLLLGVTIVALVLLSRLEPLRRPARAAIATHLAVLVLGFSLPFFDAGWEGLGPALMHAGGAVVSALAAASRVLTLVVLKRAGLLLRAPLPMVLLFATGSVIVAGAAIRASVSAIRIAAVIAEVSVEGWALETVKLLNGGASMMTHARSFLFVVCILLLLLLRRSRPSTHLNSTAPSS